MTRGLVLAACLVGAACGSAPPTVPSAPIQQPSTPPPDPPNPQPPAPIVPQIRVTKFLIFGDSNTEGEATPLSHDPGTPGVERGFPFKLDALLKARYTNQTIAVFNGGRSGERATASDTLARLIGLVTTYRPDVLILMHGVNDLNSQVPIADVVGAVEGLVGEGRRRGIPVLLCTLPPQRPGGPKAFAPERIPRYNDALVRMAADEGAVVVDIHAQFPLELVAPDGLHITQEGNQLIAQILFDRLKALYELPNNP